MADATYTTPTIQRKRGRKKKRPSPCVVDGCETPSKHKGMCVKHHGRFVRLGHTGTIRNVGTSEERFSRSWKLNEENGCWEWTAYVHPKGYGLFCVPPNNKKIKAHRFAYELYVGKIPEGMLVCHKCDNRKCIRPDHLFIGSHQDNLSDMVKKGRRPPSEIKLNLEKAKTMRLLFQTKAKSISEIAEQFNITYDHCLLVLNGQVWKGD